MNNKNILDKFVPAEWDYHRTIFMAPGDVEADDGKTPPEFGEQYRILSREISDFGAVTYFDTPNTLRDVVYQGANTYLPLTHFDVWARDTAFIPLRTANGLVALVPKYTHYGQSLALLKPGAAKDGDLAKRLAGKLRMAIVETELAFEGGAIESDGEGTLLVTETCLLDERRNPTEVGETYAAKKARIETMLKAATGARAIIWLYGSSSRHDITKGHVDGIARFIKSGVVVLQEPDDDAGDARADFERNYTALKDATDANGHPLRVEIVRGPRRDPGWTSGFCDSYVNFLFVNGGLIMPAFGDKERDAAAQEKFRSLLPDREIRSVNVNAICALGGGIHCVTSSLPHTRITFEDVRTATFEHFAAAVRKKHLNSDLESIGRVLESKMIQKFSRNGQEERAWIPKDVDNAKILKAAALALASNQRRWEDVKEDDLIDALKNPCDDDSLRKSLSACLKGGTVESDVTAMIKWRALLQHYPSFAEEVLDPIVSRFINAPALEDDNEHGLSDVEKTALISASFVEKKNDRCPEICNKIAIGMLVPLASEFFRNLGRPGFKPDRHIKALLTLWMPNLPQAMKRAEQLNQRHFLNRTQERVRMLAYCILGDWFTRGEEDKTRADQIIWTYGSVTARDPAARILPPGSASWIEEDHDGR